MSDTEAIDALTDLINAGYFESEENGPPVKPVEFLAERGWTLIPTATLDGPALRSKEELANAICNAKCGPGNYVGGHQEEAGAIWDAFMAWPRNLPTPAAQPQTEDAGHAKRHDRNDTREDCVDCWDAAYRDGPATTPEDPERHTGETKA